MPPTQTQVPSRRTTPTRATPSTTPGRCPCPHPTTQCLPYPRTPVPHPCALPALHTQHPTPTGAVVVADPEDLIHRVCSLRHGELHSGVLSKQHLDVMRLR